MGLRKYRGTKYDSIFFIRFLDEWRYSAPSYVLYGGAGCVFSSVKCTAQITSRKLK